MPSARAKASTPVSNLYAGATYDLFRGVGVYARLDNLLNQDYRYDWCYPHTGHQLLGRSDVPVLRGVVKGVSSVCPVPA